MLDWDNDVLENQYKIVVSLFGAAYAAPNKGTTISYWFRSLSTLLSPTENSRIQGLFEAFKWFSSTFQCRFNFLKDFSRQSCIFKYFSDLCEPCITNLCNNDFKVVIGELSLRNLITVLTVAINHPKQLLTKETTLLLTFVTMTSRPS